MTRTKSIKAIVKAVGLDDDLGLGQFTAYASIFDNVDSYGDVVMKGAFTNTLDEWSKSGAPIPVYWSHLMGGDPTMNLGEVLTAEEDEKGLLVTAQLDVEHNEKAAYTYRLLKGRRVQQMSFAYDVIDGEEHEDSFGADLKELKLHEVSVVPLGANSETEILDVKALNYLKRPEAVLTAPQWASMQAALKTPRFDPMMSALAGISYSAGGILPPLKSGRKISAKNEITLRAALDSLSAATDAVKDVLSIIDSVEEEDPEKASGKRPAKSDERGSVKLDEPSATPTVDAWAAELSVYELRG